MRARNFVDSNCDELQLESALIESVSQCAMAQRFADLREPCDLPARRGIRRSEAERSPQTIRFRRRIAYKLLLPRYASLTHIFIYLFLSFFLLGTFAREEKNLNTALVFHGGKVKGRGSTNMAARTRSRDRLRRDVL